MFLDFFVPRWTIPRLTNIKITVKIIDILRNVVDHKNVELNPLEIFHLYGSYTLLFLASVQCHDHFSVLNLDALSLYSLCCKANYTSMCIIADTFSCQ